MIVEWAREARLELREQFTHVAQSQPAAAARIAERIFEAADRLDVYPRYGRLRSTDELGEIREISVARTRFVILYSFDEAQGMVTVLHVLHGAQSRERFVNP